MAIQLIRNGGFETGTLLPGWRQTPGSATFDGGITDASHHAGDYSLELRAMDFVEQTFTYCIAHATGDLTLWIKAGSATAPGPFFVRIEYTDGTQETPFLGSVSTRWELKTFAVDHDKRLKKIAFGTGESGSIFIDDVSLVGSRRLLAMGEMHRPAASRSAAEASTEEEIAAPAGAIDERLGDIEEMLATLLSFNAKASRVGKVPS